MTDCDICVLPLTITEIVFPPCQCGVKMCTNCVGVELGIANKEDLLEVKCPVCLDPLDAEYLQVDREVIEEWLQENRTEERFAPFFEEMLQWHNSEITQYLWLERRNELMKVREMIETMATELQEVTDRCADDDLSHLPPTMLSRKSGSKRISIGYKTRKSSLRLPRAQSAPQIVTLKELGIDVNVGHAIHSLTPKPARHLDDDSDHLPDLVPMQAAFWKRFGDESDEEEIDSKVSPSSSSARFGFRRFMPSTPKSLSGLPRRDMEPHYSMSRSRFDTGNTTLTSPQSVRSHRSPQLGGYSPRNRHPRSKSPDEKGRDKEKQRDREKGKAKSPFRRRLSRIGKRFSFSPSFGGRNYPSSPQSDLTISLGLPVTVVGLSAPRASTPEVMAKVRESEEHSGRSARTRSRNNSWDDFHLPRESDKPPHTRQRSSSLDITPSVGLSSVPIIIHSLGDASLESGSANARHTGTVEEEEEEEEEDESDALRSGMDLTGHFGAPKRPHLDKARSSVQLSGSTTPQADAESEGSHLRDSRGLVRGDDQALAEKKEKKEKKETSRRRQGKDERNNESTAQTMAMSMAMTTFAMTQRVESDSEGSERKVAESKGTRRFPRKISARVGLSRNGEPVRSMTPSLENDPNTTSNPKDTASRFQCQCCVL